VDGEVPGWLKLDPESPHPPYEQLRQLIVEAANSGRIAVGARLPPVRTLAVHLGVAANTVARAYRELERAPDRRDPLPRRNGHCRGGR
jgi:DNA-binding transcriptional regulator YhcF (GntR family)